MDYFAVAGRPILHSRSPQIFKAMLRSLGRPGRYVRLAAETAGQALEIFRDLNLTGLNVTTPFKAEIMSGLDNGDEASAAISAVNVVHRQENVWRGANTDHLGVSGALAEHGFAARGLRCLVAGAGGAGRAAAYALSRGGGDVVILDPVSDRADRAARDLGLAAVPIAEWKTEFEKAALLVSAAPGGSVSIGDCRVRPGQVILDADYRNPVLRGEAAARGLEYISGLEWLKHQAVPALGLFLDIQNPAVNIDWNRCLEGPARNDRDVIALIGFMGSGKSAIGRALAERLGYDFADTDEWIERSEGKTVADIFDTRGEAYFRDREKEAMGRMVGGRRLVLSCGGGVVLDTANRAVLGASALTIWIHASMETTLTRLGGVDRPLLRGASRLEQASLLFAARRDAYFAAADLVVVNEGDLERAIGRILEETRSPV